MKVLLHGIVWAPEDQTERHEAIRKHLNAFSTYEGDFDVLITVNGCGEKVQAIIDSAPINAKVIDYETNKGWAFARNTAIKYAIENGYDLLCMLDGDIYVEDKQWVLKAIEVSKVQPAFMCRMTEPEHRIERLRSLGVSWDMYDEWLGCINVATVEVLKAIGGYDFSRLPKDWGFSDCLWGRQLRAAGYLDNFDLYPSLSNLGVIEVQEDTYNKFLDPIKEDAIKTYRRTFWSMSEEILSGAVSYFIDYNLGQDDKFKEYNLRNSS